jgi:hypothetical protein
LKPTPDTPSVLNERDVPVGKNDLSSTGVTAAERQFLLIHKEIAITEAVDRNCRGTH